MSQAGAPECLEAIFKEIDTNADGVISRQDLEATKYAQTLFESNDNVLMVHYCPHRPSVGCTTG
jgi:Ca2+-binding EF-hand superfamily protein